VQQTTLCFLVRSDPPRQVLLGLKKHGFGAGKYGGIGGKVAPGETVVEAAAREMAEETGVTVSAEDLRPAGSVWFLFPARPEWSQVMHLLLASRWQGEPAESAEVIPVWFDVTKVPYQQMWPDAVYWLPRILAGERVYLRFVYAEDNETLAAGPEEWAYAPGPPEWHRP